MKFRRPKPPPSPFDQKIGSIEAEMERIRNEMRTLRRSGGRPVETVAAPRLQARPPATRPPPEPAAPARDLFAHAARREPPALADTGETDGRGGSGFTMDKQKFGRYFSSGSFLASHADSVDRRVMRNRAILMVVVVLIVGFVIYRLFN